MAERAVPTLSSSGFVVQVAEKADRLLSYFFTSEASQSELYNGSIASLPDLIQKFNDQTTELVKATESLLSAYFSRHFDNVNVIASTNYPQPGDESRTNLTIRVTFVDKGQPYDLGRIVNIVDSKIAKIIHLNNTGEFSS